LLVCWAGLLGWSAGLVCWCWSPSVRWAPR